MIHIISDEQTAYTNFLTDVTEVIQKTNVIPESMVFIGLTKDIDNPYITVDNCNSLELETALTALHRLQMDTLIDERLAQHELEELELLDLDDEEEEYGTTQTL